MRISDWSSDVCSSDLFGPIGAVIGFDDDDEAIALANASDFGLSGAIYSADAGQDYRMALTVRTGGVSIKGGAGRMQAAAAFGRIKRAGYGRGSGYEWHTQSTTQKEASCSFA